MARFTDRELGMDRDITRRDLLHGAGALAVGFGTGAARRLGAQTLSGEPNPAARTGLRGSHRGSFETAHALALDGKRNWGTIVDAPDPVYDLVIVGAGLSGLSAAWFYLEKNPDAKILILDNHDDFGGHAKRNEFRVDGRLLLGHGGSQTLEAPSRYSEVAKRLVREVGVDIDAFEEAYDQEFLKRHGLAGSIYFDEETFGTDRLVRQRDDESNWLMTATDVETRVDAIARYPIAEDARAQLRSLYSGSAAQEYPDWTKLRLRNLSYLELMKHVGVEHPDALKVLDGLATPLACLGIDAIPAAYAFHLGLPSPRGLPANGPSEPYIHHFPDGNAGLARLLVRSLIPEAVPGKDMFDVVLAQARYDELDADGRATRIRLDSTVVDVAHRGPASSAREVDVVYVKDGTASRVRGRHCILACYNMVIPHLCAELPSAQKEALTRLVKSPLVYTNVALRNWRAWKQLGIGFAYSPGRWHHYVYLDFPVSLGDYRFSETPDDPIVVHLDWEPRAPGLSPQDQFREGRRVLLKTKLQDVEREVRTHFAGLLGPGGFDPAEDIAAITVNRWPHGYAPEGSEVESEAPHKKGRKPWGRIAIANSDAGASAYVDAAIDQAWRAVGDVT